MIAEQMPGSVRWPNDVFADLSFAGKLRVLKDRLEVGCHFESRLVFAKAHGRNK
jgi:hypothetical protein